MIPDVSRKVHELVHASIDVSLSNACDVINIVMNEKIAFQNQGMDSRLKDKQ